MQKKRKPRKTILDTWTALSSLVDEGNRISRRIEKDSNLYATRTDKFVSAILRDKPKSRVKARVA